MTFGSPIGSLVYLIFALINRHRRLRKTTAQPNLPPPLLSVHPYRSGARRQFGLARYVFQSLLTLAPVAGPEDSNDVRAVREPNGKNAFSHAPEAEIPLLPCAVRSVFGNDPIRIAEGVLRQRERNTVFGQVRVALAIVPVKRWPFHAATLSQIWLHSHIPVWCTKALERAEKNGASRTNSLPKRVPRSGPVGDEKRTPETPNWPAQ